LLRQRGHTLLFVAHEARHLDRNIVASADVVILKEPEPQQVRFERGELRNLLEDAASAFAGKSRKTNLAYVWSPRCGFRGLLRNDLPTFWCNEISVAYRSVGDTSSTRPVRPMDLERRREEEKRLRSLGYSYKQIVISLGVSKATVIRDLRQRTR